MSRKRLFGLLFINIMYIHVCSWQRISVIQYKHSSRLLFVIIVVIITVAAATAH